MSRIKSNTTRRTDVLFVWLVTQVTRDWIEFCRAGRCLISIEATMEFSWLRSLGGEKFRNELTDRSKKKKSVIYAFGPAGLIPNSFVTLFQLLWSSRNELIRELTANRYVRVSVPSICARVAARIFRHNACCFSCSLARLRAFMSISCAPRKKHGDASDGVFGFESNVSRKTLNISVCFFVWIHLRAMNYSNCAFIDFWIFFFFFFFKIFSVTIFCKSCKSLNFTYTWNKMLRISLVVFAKSKRKYVISNIIKCVEIIYHCAFWHNVHLKMRMKAYSLQVAVVYWIWNAA